MHSKSGTARLSMGWAIVLCVLISPTSLPGSPLLLSRPAGTVALTHGENAVKLSGGAVRHTFPSGHMIVDVDEDRWDELRDALPAGWAVYDAPIAAPSGPAEQAWNRMVKPRLVSTPGQAKTGQPLSNCVIVRNPNLRDVPEGAQKSAGPTDYGPYGAGFWDGSEFFLGKIAIAVITPESNGMIDPSTEDWTQEESDHIAAHVTEAMNWWGGQTDFEPLSFTYEYHFAVPTSYEPIERPQSDEALWVDEVLSNLGYGGPDRFTKAQNFVNDLKSRHGADWAFLLFVVDSSNDPDGMFASGHFAYSYLGGPFLVLTLDNDGWGQENFSSVCAHEVGHIFYALDEYYSAATPCDAESGYLRYRNENSQYGSCLEDVPFSIMRSVPLDFAEISSSTRGQIGWVDADGDGIPDVSDTEPTVSVLAIGKSSTALVEGQASVVPIPNLNPVGYGHAVSINRIASVEYRLDGGDWIEAIPDDSTWDGGLESFHFEPAAPDTGLYWLEVRGVNSVGRPSAAFFEGSIEIHGATGVSIPGLSLPSIVIGHDARPNPFNPRTEIHLQLLSDIRGRVAVYSSAGRLVQILFDGEIPAGDAAFTWDGTDRNGRSNASGRYFYRLESNGNAVTGSMVLVR